MSDQLHYLEILTGPDYESDESWITIMGVPLEDLIEWKVFLEILYKGHYKIIHDESLIQINDLRSPYRLHDLEYFLKKRYPNAIIRSRLQRHYVDKHTIKTRN